MSSGEGDVVKRWLQQRPLFGFFVLTFLWSWICWGLSPIIKPQSEGLATSLMFAGSFGPSLAAIVVVAITQKRAGLHAWFLYCLRWPVSWGWLVMALLFPLIVLFLAARLHIALGGDIATSAVSGHLLMTALNFFLILLLGGPLGEEFGWRGYALPILQDRFGWRSASVGLGMVWGIWHLPLFFIDGTAQTHIPPLLFFLSAVAMSVLFAWLVNRNGGSLVAVLLLHTAINFWPAVVPVLPTETSYRAYAFVVAILVAFAVGLMVRPDQSPKVRYRTDQPARHT